MQVQLLIVWTNLLNSIGQILSEITTAYFQLILFKREREREKERERERERAFKTTNYET